MTSMMKIVTWQIRLKDWKNTLNILRVQTTRGHIKTKVTDIKPWYSRKSVTWPNHIKVFAPSISIVDKSHSVFVNFRYLKSFLINNQCKGVYAEYILILPTWFFWRVDILLYVQIQTMCYSLFRFWRVHILTRVNADYALAIHPLW